jgi:hypothetical protein
MPRINPLAPLTDPLPPEEVRFLEVRVEPWPDGQRVRVHVTLTPFQKRPNLVAQIFDAEKRLLSQADIIETMDDRLVFTMHLRADAPQGPFRLAIVTGYEEMGQIDQREVDFRIDEARS